MKLFEDRQHQDIAILIRGFDWTPMNPDPKMLDTFCDEYLAKVKSELFKAYNLKPPGPTIKPAERVDIGTMMPNSERFKLLHKGDVEYDDKT